MALGTSTTERRYYAAFTFQLQYRPGQIEWIFIAAYYAESLIIIQRPAINVALYFICDAV